MSAITTRWEAFLDRVEAKERRNAQRLPGWRTRKRRRELTVVMVFANLVLVVAAAVSGRGDSATFYVPWFAGLALWFVSFWLLRILTGKMSSAFLSLLDEREREWRQRVTYVAYQVLTGLMLVAMLYTVAIARQPDAGFRAGSMMASLLIVGSSAPAALLGWTLPDDDPEDSDA